MSKHYIKIKCESSDLKEALLQILMMSKNQLQEHITVLLGRKGIASDTKIKILDDEITVTQKTTDRGMVITSQGIGMETAGYDVLPDNSKYMIVEQGVVKLLLKRPDKIDIELARFEDLEGAIAAINSNDIVDAVNNIINPKTPTLLDENTDTGISTEADAVEQNGDTAAAV